MGKKSLAALLCATMAMTACMLPATAAMADEPLKIEFFQQKGEEGPQKGYKEIIDKFNKENSDIEIEMNTVPDRSGACRTSVPGSNCCMGTGWCGNYRKSCFRRGKN